jgi:hypothetical protein
MNRHILRGVNFYIKYCCLHKHEPENEMTVGTQNGARSSIIIFAAFQSRFHEPFPLSFMHPQFRAVAGGRTLAR